MERAQRLGQFVFYLIFSILVARVVYFVYVHTYPIRAIDWYIGLPTAIFMGYGIKNNGAFDYKILTVFIFFFLVLIFHSGIL